MAAIGKATVEVVPDITHFASTLRIIAKHAQACADELELNNRSDDHPVGRNT